jgi:hypothetical protein
MGRRCGGRTMLNAVLTVIAVLGFAITLLTLFPRITVSNDAAIDPTDPFSTPFVVSNDGYLPLLSVRCWFYIKAVHLTHGSRIFESRVTTDEWTTRRLLPTEKLSVYGGKAVRAPGQLLDGDISIIVEYRPFLWPFTMRQISSRFRTLKGPAPDGRLYWTHRPLSD